MAFAQRIITSNSAGDQEFTFTFPFIKEEHIKVFVNFVEKNQGTASSEFQVITNTTPNKIRLGTGLSANNTRVEIRRVSSINTVLVDFEDGSTLTAADLDTNSKQSLFIAQELDDAQKQGLSIDLTTGVPTLNSQRLSGVSDPINAQDAVTKNYLERTGSITSTQISDGTIVNGDINANADIAVSKLDHGTARQILQTNAAGNNVEFTSNVDIPGTLDVTGNVDLDANLNVDGTTTLDATTVDGALTATSVTVGALNISYIDAVNQGTHILHDGTDDLRLQIAANQMIFEQSDGVNFMSMTHTSFDSDPEVQGRVNISHAGSGIKISTKTDGIKVNGKVDLDSITGTGVVTTGTSTSDEQVYSSKRAGEIIDARIIELVDEVGGFVPIANETSFPTENPDINTSGSAKSGTIVSVQAASTALPNGSTATLNGTTLTISNGRGAGNAVIITGVSATIPSGFGFLVETTETDHTYAFHRLVPKAADVTTVAGQLGASGSITTVVAEISPTNNISAVASVANNLSAFNATFRGQVTDVANDAADIGAVAGKAAEIGRLGTTEAVADLAILGTTDAVADMATIADTANLISNIGTVASYASNINTVGGSIDNVNTVGTNITNVNNASNYLNNFLQLYLGVASSDPVVDGLGNAITEGDLYFNNVDKRVRVFNGSVFQNLGEGVVEVAKFANAAFNALYTAAAGSNSIDLGSLAIAGAVFANEAIPANRVSLGRGTGTTEYPLIGPLTN